MSDHCTHLVPLTADFLPSNWKWPDVPGVSRFPTKLHSAAWDDSVDLTDKVVGIIGNGSSAVQIIPSIFPSMPLVDQLEKACG